jgi:hypothetical protein
MVFAVTLIGAAGQFFSDRQLPESATRQPFDRIG